MESSVENKPVAMTTDLFGQPIGLFILFFTEMWERFSYYGMRALLVLYLVEEIASENPGLGWNATEAGSLYGWYTMLVYITPILGGIIADKVFGFRKAITLGAILMSMGHFSLAFEPMPAFYLGLGLLIVGNGFFKPNISSMVGQLYQDGSKRKDSGYTIFYQGINVGAFLGSILCGYLAETIGWHWGFGLAGVFMVIGMIQFQLSQKMFGEIGLAPKKTVEVTPEVEAIESSTEESTGQVKLTINRQENYSKGELLLRTFFGFLYIDLPHMISLLLVSIWSSVLTFIAFWSILFTGRYPQSFFEFQVGMHRWNLRWLARFFNLSDGYPAFGINATDENTDLQIAYPENLSRGKLLLKTFFGGLYVILPHLLVLGFASLWGSIQRFIAWWTVLFTGTYPESMHNYNVGLIRWTLRINLYMGLMSDDYPPFSGRANPDNGLTKVESQRLIVVAVLAFFSIFFWAAFEQAGSSMNIFAKEYTDRSLDEGALLFKIVSAMISFLPVGILVWLFVGLIRKLGKEYRAGMGFMALSIAILTGMLGWMVYDQFTEENLEVPATWFQSLNALFIFTLAPLFSWVWRRLADTRFNPTGPQKFSIGLVLLGIGFIPLVNASAGFTGDNPAAKVSMIFLVLAYLLHTMGELSLSPVGLSYVSKLSPKRLVGVMFGIWFFASAMGNMIAGQFSGYMEKIAEESSMSEFFEILVYIPVGAGIVFFILSFALKKLTHGIH